MVNLGIARLGRVVIPAANMVEKAVGGNLICKPTWRYMGPACTITITRQVGHWGLTFDGMSPIVSTTINQAASATLKEFTPTIQLAGIALTNLIAVDSTNIYDVEMWFKSSAFADQGAIFTGAVHVPLPPSVGTLEIASCSFS